MMRKLSASELVARHMPALSTSGPSITVTFTDEGLASAFLDRLLAARCQGAAAADDEPRASSLDRFFEGGEIGRRLFEVEASLKMQRRRINALMAAYVEGARLPNGRVPGCCCQCCGAPIGYIGRAFEAVGVLRHVCPAQREAA